MQQTITITYCDGIGCNVQSEKRSGVASDGRWFDVDLHGERRTLCPACFRVLVELFKERAD